ncbi:hypothetical protein CLV31_11082 [Algoriphagus aquaeductus]|uniref:DUF4382 domain-containing protein n=1 Tax=Algoriphagus aquaeductus TaxID=475299 RepID=A0A326RPW8_9BACT|nr:MULTISPECIES: hypothetical protein [Algoriphagus]PZV81550.1 hypothetical protein CLV31_11082 [Algoriphagus aquaeductus]
MKTTHRFYALAFAAFTFAFTSCTDDNDPEVLGSGEVKMGMGVKLRTSNNPGARIANTGLDITSGFLQVKKIELETEGVDEAGREFEKEFEFKFREIKKINFDELNSNADFFIAIPAGNYEEIEVEIDLIDNKNQPSIQLDGTYTYQDGRTVPFRLEVFGDDDDDMDFEVELEAEDDDDLFFLNGVNNPLALLQIDAKSWFRTISTSALETAELTDGVLLINRNKNRTIYRSVEDRIKASSDIELKMR